MVQVTVQVKGSKPVELSLDGTVHQVTVADVKRGVQKQVSKVSEVMPPPPRATSTFRRRPLKRVFRRQA